MDKVITSMALTILSCIVISDGAEYDIQTITSQMDAYEKQMDSIKIKYSYESPINDKDEIRNFIKGTFAQNKSKGYVLLDKILQRGKTWNDDEEPEGIIEGNIRSYNREITRYFGYEKNQQGYHLASLSKKHNPKLYKSRGNPYYNIWRPNYKNTTFSDKLNDPNSMAVIQGEELIEGLKTINVNFKEADGVLDCHLWLLPDRNYLPIKLIVYHKEYKDGKHPLVVTHWCEFKEYPGGIWYPMSIKKYIRHLKVPILFKTEEVDFSPLTKEDFEFDFPAMTHVTDFTVLELDYKSLKGKPLPELIDLGIKVSPGELDNKRLLICFFDIEQRPSRHCCLQLAKLSDQLRQKRITVIVVQASKVDPKYLAKWVQEHKIPFPVGTLKGDAEQTRMAWGTKSLPWLILTDDTHKVVAEGFTLQKLNDIQKP